MSNPNISTPNTPNPSDSSDSVPHLSASTADKLLNGHIVARDPHWTVLKASSEGLREYLQGQITQDIKRLFAQQGIHACLLTPQGKAVSELYILEINQDELVILTPAATAEVVVGRLRQFALGYKLRIGMVDSLAIWNVRGASSIDFLSESGLERPENTWLSTTRHPQHECLAMRMNAQKNAFWVVAERTLFAQENQTAASELEALRIIDGQTRFTCEWDASMHPLNANLIEFDGVSFDKGCYVGQEVTSRMHWRGGIRKKLYRVQVSAVNKDSGTENTLPDIPCPILSSAPVGMLRSLACDHENHSFGIALLPIETADSSAPLKLENGTEINVIEACHA